MRTSRDSHTVAADGAQAIAAALTPPGQIATLILPADTAWGEGSGIAPVPRGPARAAVSEDQLREASDTLRRGGRTLLLLGDRAVRAEGLGLAARIASRTGARYLAQTANARMERGAGRPAIERLPYAVDAAVEVLANCECIILVGATPPVAFFGYPGKPSELSPAHCRIVTRAAPHEDQVDALARLADAVHARRPETQETLKVDDGWLKNERKRIEDAYTFQINNFGRVILYSDRDAFDKAAERFRLVARAERYAGQFKSFVREANCRGIFEAVGAKPSEAFHTLGH